MLKRDISKQNWLLDKPNFYNLLYDFLSFYDQKTEMQLMLKLTKLFLATVFVLVLFQRLQPLQDILKSRVQRADRLVQNWKFEGIIRTYSSCNFAALKGLADIGIGVGRIAARIAVSAIRPLPYIEVWIKYEIGIGNGEASKQVLNRAEFERLSINIILYPIWSMGKRKCSFSIKNGRQTKKFRLGCVISPKYQSPVSSMMQHHPT